MSEESPFELVDYELIAELNNPLIVGTMNLGVWEFHGVRTIEPEIKVHVFEALMDHFENNKEMFEKQALFFVTGNVVGEECSIELKVLAVQEADKEPDGEPNLPNLPIGYFNKNSEHYQSFFDGKHVFHENYPQFMKSIEPLIVFGRKYF